jgi:hypothetical protein
VAALTGLRAIQKDPGYATGISVDQWMANKWGSATRFKTVEFGVKNRTSGNRGCISYLGANQPVFPENDPVKAYARYFGGYTPPVSSGGAPMPDVAAERMLLRRKSSLDFVRADLDRLHKRLPGDERVRLERHLESLRDLERQLAPTAAAGGAGCQPTPPRPSRATSGRKGNGDYKALSKLQIDNMFMAPGLRSVAPGPPHLGRRDQPAAPPLAGLQRSPPRPVPPGQRARGEGEADQDQPLVRRGVRLLHRPHGQRGRGNGKTMLDNSLVIWLNGMGEGKSHTRNNIPFVLAGLGGGAIKGGRFLTYNTAHNQLLVSILHMMGFRDQNTFGDPEWSGPLPGLVT